jgi:hypothetical protein
MKNFSSNNLLASNQFHQFQANSTKIKNPKKNPIENNSGILKVKTPNHLSYAENEILSNTNSNSFILNECLNGSKSKLLKENKKKNNIPLNFEKKKPELEKKRPSIGHQMEAQNRLKSNKGLKLDSSVNMINSQVINDLSDYDSNRDQNQKNSNSTKDSSVKNSILQNNRLLESATIEDMHIIIVKFSHQSKKIEKSIEAAEFTLNENYQENLQSVFCLEEEIDL